MRLKQQIVLSIGSNLGDRSENLRKCVQQIALEFGEIKEISGIYETPSWGFASGSFYNAVISLETTWSPQFVLEKLQQIENQLGKIRHENKKEYHDRIIDIDIVLFGDQVINTPDLQIPHPHFPQRLFVLRPLQELQLNWKHPLSHLTVNEMLQNCADTSTCVRIGVIN